ncbi:MAG: hypothetical protein V4636_17560, partial [Pseudomonadota bacterium]
MPEFLVTTWEHVEGLYTVEAADEAAARKKFKAVPGRLIDFNGVEQISYSAFEVEVRKVDVE